MIKKIFLLISLFFSTQAFAQGVIIYFTSEAQAKIDNGLDRGMYGPINMNAFNIQLEFIPLVKLDNTPTIFCGFICAQPHRSTFGNAEAILMPSFKGTSLHVTLNTELIKDKYVGEHPTLHLTFASKTEQLQGIQLPKDVLINLSQEKYEITIDYTELKGFFSAGDDEV